VYDEHPVVIPTILHFCVRAFSDGRRLGARTLSCVKSAVERIKPEQAFSYFGYPPNDRWWGLTTEIVTCERITAPARSLAIRKLILPIGQMSFGLRNY
jgi:hypothetical protein